MQPAKDAYACPLARGNHRPYEHVHHAENWCSSSGSVNPCDRDPHSQGNPQEVASERRPGSDGV